MQQEDDLRALAKIMDFLRAASIILVVMRSNSVRLACPRTCIGIAMPP